MNINKNDNTPGSPYEWYELGVSLRQRERFGEAINAFRNAEETAAALIERLSSGQSADGSDAAAYTECTEKYSITELQTLHSRAAASIELILRIRGFVNKDLMNP